MPMQPESDWEPGHSMLKTVTRALGAVLTRGRIWVASLRNSADQGVRESLIGFSKDATLC